MKIAGSTIAFTGKPLGEALAGLAGMGFDQVDLLTFHGWAHINPADLVGCAGSRADEVRRMLDEHGLQAAALNAKPTFHMNTPVRSEQERNLEELKALGEFARRVGAGRVTLQPGPGDAGGSMEAALGLSIEAFARTVEAIAGEDLVISFEPHANSVAESYPAMRRYLEAVPGLTVCYDPSHFIGMGWEVEASTFLLPRVGNVHLRNAVKGQIMMPMGEGTLDLEWVLCQLAKSGYEGSLSIEYFANDRFDWLAETVALKERLERLLDR